MKTKVLHITDLHVSDPYSPNENLRKAYYKEFLEPLTDEIIRTVESIDYIVCTGDFIDKGKVENFEHVKEIFEYLRLKLNLEKENVLLCLGNHDIIRKLEEERKIKDSREKVLEFLNFYSPNSKLKSGAYYDIYSIASNTAYFLRLDSLYNSNGSNKPGVLSDSDIDNLIQDLDSVVHPNAPMLVLSHYPMIIFDRPTYALEESNWFDNHLWKSGHDIVLRCSKKRRRGLTLWFFGDAHIPDFWSYSDYNHFIMTGMVGGNYLNPPVNGAKASYNKYNEVKVVDVDFTGEKKEMDIYTFSYRSKSQTPSPHHGNWEITKSSKRIVDSPIPSITETQVTQKDDESTLISSSIQETILSQVSTKKLYKLNRYITSTADSSLAWVSMSKLFENLILLDGCVSKASEWIKNKIIINNDIEETCILGIDFWGGIISTQISVRLGCKNYTIATKSDGKHNSFYEKSDYLCEKLKINNKVKNIVVVTDVICTGGTIAGIRKKTISILGNNYSWSLISVISDSRQTKKDNLNDFINIGTFCSDLRIPIISNDDLPDENILPPKFDLR